MRIACAFAAHPDTPDHIALAESLGYDRAWVYDSPALYADVWVTLAFAATRTSRIGLGPGVLVPNLRHVMTNAAAAATIAALAPGRLTVAIGAGFTGRMTLGQRSLPWRSVGAYIAAFRGLLRGEEPEWEGAPVKMLHTPGFIPGRPLNIPVIAGADGPKGLAVAKELCDGIFTAGITGHGFNPAVKLTMGTVLAEGEDAGSARVMAAAGHAGAVAYHGRYERGGIEHMPGGERWKAHAEGVPAHRRHLAIHEGHLVEPSPLDLASGVITGELLAQLRHAAAPESWRERLAGWEAAGITEVAYQPAGPDIPRELRAFMAMARP